MTTKVLRVAVVNDFDLIVRGVAGMLGPFSDRVKVVELDVRSNPEAGVDIALFDTYGHARGGVDRVRSLAAEPRVGAVVVYTWELPPGQTDALLAAGARGVLAKSTPPDVLADTFATIASGEVVISSVFRRPNTRMARARSRIDRARERGRRAVGPGTLECRDRRGSVHQRAHREEPFEGDLPEDRRRLAGASDRADRARPRLPTSAARGLTTRANRRQRERAADAEQEPERALELVEHVVERGDELLGLLPVVISGGRILRTF